MTKEYKDLRDEDMAKKTILRIGEDKRNSHRKNLHLYHLSAGYETAGSCARLQEHETWGVRFLFDKSYHGKRFKTLAEAEAYFNQLIGEH